MTMTDELVKALREFADDGYPELSIAAAARIEQLVATTEALTEKNQSLALDHLAALGQMAEQIEALTAERDRLRGGIEYVLDGYGLNGPDYRFQDGEDGDWISDRLVAALKGETP